MKKRIALVIIVVSVAFASAIAQTERSPRRIKFARAATVALHAVTWGGW
ncbi:MAG TPA: hypothetical protein VFZ40_04760 [Pyrinomonadaceae bacterium]